MEIKKCSRCGSFYTSDAQVCQNCMPKDKQDMVKLQGYVENNSCNLSKQQISIDTGISIRNLNRYLQAEEFKDIYINEDITNNGAEDASGNLSINL